MVDFFVLLCVFYVVFLSNYYTRLLEIAAGNSSDQIFSTVAVFYILKNSSKTAIRISVSSVLLGCFALCCR